MEDNFIAKFPKPDTSDKKFHWNTGKPKTCAYRSTKIDKTPENSTDQSESQNIYASMAHMSSNAEIPRRDFGDSSQPTNWILYSGVTCHMQPEISDFITGPLAEIDKYTKIADGNFVTAKQTG